MSAADGIRTRIKSVTVCYDCGGAGHSTRCPSPDRELAEQIRADETAATAEIVKLLASKVRRVRWIRVLLDAYRRALTEESQALFHELSGAFKDLLDSAPGIGPRSTGAIR